MKDAGADSGGWKSPGVYCGEDDNGDDVHCSPGAKYCCARPAGSGQESLECVAGNPATQCAGGISIRCDDRSDCPSGQVCCGEFSNQTGYRSVSCQATCTGSTGPGLTAVRFCDKSAPVDECAEIGKTCTGSGSLDGYAVCK